MGRRTLLSVLLVVVLLLTTFGPSFAQEPAKAPAWLKRWDGVTLTLSSHTGPTTDAYKILAKDFEALTGAKVQVIDESWTDLLSKHMAAAAAHTAAYDILTWPYIWTGHYVEGDMVENLNDWFAKAELVDADYGLDDFVPAVLDAYGRYRTGFFKDPDALWSVPYKFDIYLAFYRTDLFKEIGMVDEKGEAKPPATWEELATAAEQIKAKHPEITPIVFPLAVDDPMVSTFLPVFVSYGGTVPMPWFDNNLYPQFNKQPAVDAANMVKKLLPFMPGDALSMDYDQVNAAMAQGTAAYGLNWNAYLPVLLDATKSKVSDKVAFDLAPGGPAGRAQGMGGWQMGISKDSKNKEAAFQLLEYLSGKAQGPKLALSGGSVARFSTANDPEVIKAFPYYPLLLQAMEKVALRGMDRSWAEAQRTIGIALNKVLLGEDTEKTLTDAAREVFKGSQTAGYTPEKTGPMP